MQLLGFLEWNPFKFLNKIITAKLLTLSYKLINILVDRMSQFYYNSCKKKLRNIYCLFIITKGEMS